MGALGLLVFTGLLGSSALPQNAPLAPQLPGSPAPSYVPHRVYDTHHKRFTDFESLVADISSAGIVFVGEEHDDSATHRMELALLEGIGRRRDSVVVALEMFERDVQPALDRYLAGATTEAELLSAARPWKNYAGDYRPLVELARARRWPVVASNVPRRLATLVAKSGLAGLDTLPPASRPDAAGALSCPEDGYHDRFSKEMGDMAGHGPQPSDTTSPRTRMLRMYQAQCLKDETMGESVARVWRPGTLVVHYNGSFHTDFRQGTAARAARRSQGARIVVVTAVPTGDLDRVNPSKEDRKRADYLLYVLGPVKADNARR
jgi:uncharacterized iron-regulated protein